MLADEEWEEEQDEIEDTANKTMTYEEFAEKATEILSKAKDEIRETKEIMSVSPGYQAEYDVDSSMRETALSPVSTLPTRRNVKDEKPEQPLYDQTKLDGISQLWGAPPDVLEFHLQEDDSEQTLINDGVDFRNVYSLWGEDVPAGTANVEEEEKSASTSSMEGFSQLWNADLRPYNGEDLDETDQNERTVDLEAYSGFEWWDEVTDDGKELRLSQMLADEDYEEDDEDEPPMTFEKFAEETVQLIEQAEDERRETEAILSAPPNANFLEEDTDSEYSPDPNEAFAAVAESDEFEELISSLTGESDIEPPSPTHWASLLVDPSSASLDDGANDVPMSDKDIDVLEMDDLPVEKEEEEQEEVESTDNNTVDGVLLRADDVEPKV